VLERSLAGDFRTGFFPGCPADTDPRDLPISPGSAPHISLRTKSHPPTNSKAKWRRTKTHTHTRLRSSTKSGTFAWARTQKPEHLRWQRGVRPEDFRCGRPSRPGRSGRPSRPGPQLRRRPRPQRPPQPTRPQRPPREVRCSGVALGRSDCGDSLRARSCFFFVGGEGGGGEPSGPKRRAGSTPINSRDRLFPPPFPFDTWPPPVRRLTLHRC